MYDSGPESFMAKWRAKNCSNKFKPDGIALEAWILLAGPFKNHRAVVGNKYKKRTHEPGGDQPPKKARQDAPVHYTHRVVTNIGDQCFQQLINAGYGEEQARVLVSKCRDLISVTYDNRPQATRRLTLPGEPTKRYTSFVQWVQAVLKKHPPSISTRCL